MSDRARAAVDAAFRDDWARSPTSASPTGGLATPEIARAFLVSEPVMAQRLVRAKRRLRVAGLGLRESPEQEFQLVDGLADDPALSAYHLLPAAWADDRAFVSRRCAELAGRTH